MRVLKIFLTALFILLFSVQPAHAQQVINQGHVDAFYVERHGDQLALKLKDPGDNIIAGDSVVLGVKASAWNEGTQQVPGIEAPTYFLPQGQNHSLLWPGWETTPAGVPVDFSFNVEGPGNIYVFQTDTFGGPAPVIADGSFHRTTGSVIRQEDPAHKHVNWAFTEPGTYRMAVQASSGNMISNAVTYTWQVEPRAAQGEGNQGVGEQQPAANSDQAPVENSGQTAGEQGSEAQQCVPSIIPKVKNDTVSPPEWIDANTAVFHLGEASKEQLPQAIGKVAPGTVWMIGSVQKPQVPWLGANTQHPTNSGEVTWTLTGFEGPGSMVVYEQGGLGEIVGKQWFTADGSGFEGSHTIPANTHVHPSWVFSAPGTYKVTIAQQEGEAKGEATITFVVGGNAEDGMFNHGHFDLGGEVTCAPAGSAGSAPAAPAASASQAAALADTGASLVIASLAVLGLGLTVLGAALVNYARAVR